MNPEFAAGIAFCDATVHLDGGVEGVRQQLKVPAAEGRFLNGHVPKGTVAVLDLVAGIGLAPLGHHAFSLPEQLADAGHPPAQVGPVQFGLHLSRLAFGDALEDQGYTLLGRETGIFGAVQMGELLQDPSGQTVVPFWEKVFGGGGEGEHVGGPARAPPAVGGGHQAIPLKYREVLPDRHGRQAQPLAQRFHGTPSTAL